MTYDHAPQLGLWDDPREPEPACPPPLGTPVTTSGAKDLAALLLRRARPREVPMLITWIRETNPTDVVAAIRKGPATLDATEPGVLPHVTWDEPPTPAERARKDAELALVEAGEFAAWLRERVASGELPDVIVQLQRARAKDVVEVLPATGVSQGRPRTRGLGCEAAGQ